MVLAIIQIPCASGLYPIELLPGFFHAIYPLLPFTYGIDAMRETIGGFYGTVVEVDGDVVTLATPLGDETLWSKRAIAAIEEPPFGSASAHEESGSDVEQTDNDIQDSEQDAVEPQS